MTAINVIVQPKHRCVHIASDAASYSLDGIVHGLGTKVFTVPHWPGAEAASGTSVSAPLLGSRLSNLFSDFDTMIENVESSLPSIVEKYPFNIEAELFLVGWSAKRTRPEAYSVTTYDGLPANCNEEDASISRAAGFMPERAFQLNRLPDIAQSPPVQPDMAASAYYSGIDVDARPTVIELDLRKILEMQRHDLRADGIHWCGGHGLLTTISPEGVSQKLLQRWPDKLGEKLKTLTIDWLAWCIENDMAPTAEQIALTEQSRELDRQLKAA